MQEAPGGPWLSCNCPGGRWVSSAFYSSGDELHELLLLWRHVELPVLCVLVALSALLATRCMSCCCIGGRWGHQCSVHIWQGLPCPSCLKQM